ncbi:DUF2000 family protein [Rhizobium sp. TRM95111]|uniref:DUF2000 family protein n=1 Tax=Rhizobium alarense TaxID=2846851 RepID=UPI001F317251|nr:DUF2000 family protein [Rhizobium alarense]MCF3642310.1 DUF2000 family protein [Rhizobium alarense]
MFDTKFAIVIRNDLETWQKLNVAAFLAGGLVGARPKLLGEAYRDAAGHVYTALPVQPVIVLAADDRLIRTIHRRALERAVTTSVYVEEMFATGHDTANRAAFAAFGPDDAKVVGIALHAQKKLVEKITRGAKLHA